MASNLSLEESFVAALERQYNCTQGGEAVLPPPQSCPASVHTMYGLAQLHLFTILLVAFFVILIIQMVMLAINPNAGH